MEIILTTIVIYAARPPVAEHRPMPDLRTCFVGAAQFLTSNKASEYGAHSLAAGCRVIVKGGSES